MPLWAVAVLLGVEYGTYSPSSLCPMRGVGERARQFVDEGKIGQTLRQGSMSPPQTPVLGFWRQLGRQFLGGPKGLDARKGGAVSQERCRSPGWVEC